VSGASSLKVAYIAGSPRSGSTILASLLGSQPAAFFAGEVYKLWEEGIRAGHLCSCGKPLDECEIWGPLLVQIGGSDQRSLARFMARQLALVSRTRYLPLSLPLTLSVPGRRILADRRRTALQILERLYLGLAESTGSRFIVDGSKFPLYAALLADLPSLELYIIHMVRDPHAVVFSWKRKLYDPGRRRQFGRHLPLTSSLMWSSWNAAIELIVRHQPSLRRRYLRVSYEEFAQQPSLVLARIAHFLGEGARVVGLAGNRASLPQQHSLSGNPVRFTRGPVEIRSDEDWKQGLRAVSRGIVALTTWPLLARYGYSTHWRRPTDDRETDPPGDLDGRPQASSLGVRDTRK
jgi:hypothetical protein